MHRIMTPDGSTRQSMYLRVALAMAYALFTVAGVCLLKSPSMPVTYGDASYIYSTFMVVGAFGAALGTATMRWVGEFTGLPLLGTSMAAFGIEILIHGWLHAPWLSAASAAILLGIGMVMTARWRVSLASYRFAHHVARMKATGDG